MVQKRIKVIRQDILGDRLRLLYGDGTQDVLEYGGVASRSKIPINAQPKSFVGLTLKRVKMKLDTKNRGASMSQQYGLYSQRHKVNVQKGFNWLKTNVPWLFEDRPSTAWQTEFGHGASKSNPDEYEAYDVYFRGGNHSHVIVETFNRA